MPPDQKIIDLTHQWLEKASQDFNLAKLAINANPPFLGAVAFLCQQSVEKSIKGFLVFHGKKFRKVHDINELAGPVLEIVSSLDDLLKEADTLTAYAVAYRYPDASKEELTVEKAREAIEITDKVLTEIKGLLKLR